MKKYTVIIAIIISFTFADLQAKPKNDMNLAIRNLKLANSYRENKDYNKALKLLNSSKEKFEKKNDWNSRYWLATTFEYYGYVYRDIELLDESRVCFEKALEIYRNLIKQKDGSPSVLDNIMKSIENIDSEISSINPFESNSKGANVVNYDNLKLKELPQDLPKNVTNLSFMDNKFKEFPGGLASFKNIKYLSFKKNKIANLNESLFENKELVWLDLSNNKIKKISTGFGKLSKLKVLDLSDNKLKDIPIDINKLKNLKVLNLKGNKIPFDKVKNLIKSMPNTNILHDEYVIKPEEEEEDFMDVPNQNF